MRIINIFTTIVLTVLSFTAFAGDFSSAGVAGNEARRVGKVLKGTLLESRAVSITVDAGYAAKATGATIGAAVGGVLGNKVAKGNWVMTGLIGTVGGVVGSMAAEGIASERKQGIEMIVLVEATGDLITVTQELNGTTIPANGDSVYVATINGTTRVFPVTATTGKARM